MPQGLGAILMEVYLASPNTQQQAEHCSGMPVLLSFASFSPWMWQYQPTFERVLVDWGGYTEHTTGNKIDVAKYKPWSKKWEGHADAIAGCDDINGDWKKSMANYQEIPWTFPTMHDSDPVELLPELVAMALERKTWLGIGLVPPREGKEKFVRWVCDNVPDGLHLHGWALRRYTHIRRLNSVDSTNWWRDAMDIRKKLPWLTYGETLDLIVKRYQRWTRVIRDVETEALGLFDEVVE